MSEYEGCRGCECCLYVKALLGEKFHTKLLQGYRKAAKKKKITITARRQETMAKMRKANLKVT